MKKKKTSMWYFMSRLYFLHSLFLLSLFFFLTLIPNTYADIKRISTYSENDPLFQKILSDTFSISNQNSSLDKTAILYDRILSFFKEKKLSFYRSNSYEQSFLKDNILVFDDWDHIYERFVNSEIITDENQENTDLKLKHKGFSYKNESGITKSHSFTLENNLVGVIEGNNENLKNEFVVIGMNLKKYNLSIYNNSLHLFDVNQALNTAMFLNIIENLLTRKNLLERSVLFVVFSDEYLQLSDFFSSYASDKFRKDFNGAKAFLDYFDYYNSTNPDNKNSIYTFIDIEQLSSSFFFRGNEETLLENAPTEFQYTPEFLEFLENTREDVDNLYYINHITNNTLFSDLIPRLKISGEVKTPTISYFGSFNTIKHNFLAYSNFKNKNIPSIVFGANPFAIRSNFKITPELRDYIQNNLDPEKINNFIETILIYTEYFSKIDINFLHYQIKDSCYKYFID